jgi:hypothetical protein
MACASLPFLLNRVPLHTDEGDEMFKEEKAVLIREIAQLGTAPRQAQPVAQQQQQSPPAAAPAAASGEEQPQ